MSWFPSKVSEKFPKMSDEELDRLEELFQKNDKHFDKIFQKFFSHRCMCVAMYSEHARRFLYPVLYSGLPDEEIWAELDRLAPPGYTYM